ncbi:hypothetical protein [Cuniculiplasma divulgatum]|jgi:hypothetical protein|uniref:Uncharacterized protein n=1 Tax=Cuniculiplasma divulgatum TaxID=1673428 RepID=A0A1R4A5P4_9ARCH|nr:hypothetical protein [Cuniculiplasma divulgatum]EQB69065.1 MAG: hypothetical protein AMDU5_GPLC00004G0035 [Thermoplasmatales archaeon Gpl]MCI2412242.1 hypothetical protein [Cuniculiplasma sp.]WMT48636.1 MAG: hypothetical protein RE472_06045 [Thermoplasmatales archaeon]SJK84293.1 hypothetical protein CPM_0409 [Cuniculiplasma divulgatum]
MHSIKIRYRWNSQLFDVLFENKIIIRTRVISDDVKQDFLFFIPSEVAKNRSIATFLKLKAEMDSYGNYVMSLGETREEFDHIKKMLSISGFIVDYMELSGEGFSITGRVMDEKLGDLNDIILDGARNLDDLFVDWIRPISSGVIEVDPKVYSEQLMGITFLDRKMASSNDNTTFLEGDTPRLNKVTMIGTLDDNYDRSVINVEEVIGSSKFVTLNGIYSDFLKKLASENILTESRVLKARLGKLYLQVVVPQFQLMQIVGLSTKEMFSDLIIEEIFKYNGNSSREELLELNFEK